MVLFLYTKNAFNDFILQLSILNVMNILSISYFRETYTKAVTVIFISEMTYLILLCNVTVTAIHNVASSIWQTNSSCYVRGCHKIKLYEIKRTSTTVWFYACFMQLVIMFIFVLQASQIYIHHATCWIKQM